MLNPKASHDSKRVPCTKSPFSNIALNPVASAISKGAPNPFLRRSVAYRFQHESYFLRVQTGFARNRFRARVRGENGLRERGGNARRVPKEESAPSRFHSRDRPNAERAFADVLLARAARRSAARGGLDPVRVRTLEERHVLQFGAGRQ